MTAKNASKSSLTTRQAADKSGMSARHIQRMITSGKLSATRSEGGVYLVDMAEFYRVFPDAHTGDNDRQKSHEVRGNDRQTLESEVRHLQEMLAEKDKQNGLINKQNEFLQQQLEAATTEKTKLIETLSSTQKLLEHVSGKKTGRRFLGLF